MARITDDGDLGAILAVFAHPDDEAYLAGALMAVAADAGRRVMCVTATRGELGFPDDDPRSIDERKALRTIELAACLDVLGVTEHHWLDYPDGGCAAVDDAEPAARLAEIIEDLRPDHVLTFGPDGQTFHDDHISVSRWTTLAVRQANHDARLLYATATPEWGEFFSSQIPMDQVMMIPDAEPPTTEAEDLAVWFTAEGELLDRKLQALKNQESQTAGLISHVGLDVYTRLIRDEFFREATPHDW